MASGVCFSMIEADVAEMDDLLQDLQKGEGKCGKKLNFKIIKSAVIVNKGAIVVSPSGLHL